MTTVRMLAAARRRAMLVWVPVTDAHGRTRMEARWDLSDGQTRRRAAVA